MIEKHITSFTQIKLDNNGYYYQAAVIFPSDPDFWDLNKLTPSSVAYNINTITHEIGHALGSEHFHEYDNINEKLKHMRNGVYASVMPYYSRIKTEENSNDACDLPFAATPGVLDERLIAINYTKQMFDPKEASEYYFKENLKNAFYSSAIISGVYAGLNSFAEHYQAMPATNTFSKTSAHLFADSLMLGGMIYLQFPIVTTTAFTLSAIAKYLPDSLTVFMPQPIKQFLQSSYSSVILNIALGLNAGKNLFPLMGTLLQSTLGSIFGTAVGAHLGQVNAQLASQATQKIAKKVSPFTAMLNRDKNYQSGILQLPGNERQSIFTSPHLFFNAKNPKNSIARPIVPLTAVGDNLRAALSV